MKPLRVLVACEFSGVVRNAFNDAGHDAWSIDLLPAEDGSNRHMVGDAREILGSGWDVLIVAHPPCTRLCNSGVRWLTKPPGKLDANTYAAEQVEAYRYMGESDRLAFMWAELDKGAELFSAFWNAPIAYVCVENPVMHRHAKERIVNYEEFGQSFQPWQFGHGEIKRTCLWLRNLPPLKPTNVVDGRLNRVHAATPGPDRWRERSRFFPGVAAAMADQWGRLVA